MHGSLVSRDYWRLACYFYISFVRCSFYNAWFETKARKNNICLILMRNYQFHDFMTIVYVHASNRIFFSVGPIAGVRPWAFEVLEPALPGEKPTWKWHPCFQQHLVASGTRISWPKPPESPGVSPPPR